MAHPQQPVMEQNPAMQMQQPGFQGQPGQVVPGAAIGGAIAAGMPLPPGMTPHPVLQQKQRLLPGWLLFIIGALTGVLVAFVIVKFTSIGVLLIGGEGGAGF